MAEGQDRPRATGRDALDVQERQREAARDAREAEDQPPKTDTVEGGRYIVGGQAVDSEGKPIKAKGD